MIYKFNLNINEVYARIFIVVEREFNILVFCKHLTHMHR